MSPVKDPENPGFGSRDSRANGSGSMEKKELGVSRVL